LPPEERRAAIIEAAIPLVARHGVQVTTRQIAEAAGIAEGTIFRVFPDKEAVIDGVIESVMDPAPTVADLAAVDLDAPLAQRLTVAVEILQQRLVGVFSIISAIGRTSARGEHDPRPPADQAHDPIMPMIAGIFAPDAPRLRHDPAQAARLLRLLVFSGTHPLISDGHRLTPAEIVDVLLHGILGTAGSAADTRTAAAKPPPSATRAPAVSGSDQDRGAGRMHGHDTDATADPATRAPSIPPAHKRNATC
jgi:AcrR family transcriptional regulator